MNHDLVVYKYVSHTTLACAKLSAVLIKLIAYTVGDNLICAFERFAMHRKHVGVLQVYNNLHLICMFMMIMSLLILVIKTPFYVSHC